MKKLFLISLAAVMILSFAACGGSSSSKDANTANDATASSEANNATGAAASDDVTLVDVTMDSGISMKLPSDMTLQDVNGTSMYVNKDSGDLAVVTVADAQGAVISDQKEDEYLASMQTKYSDVKMKRFENNNQIDGKDALVYEASLTTPEGRAVTQTSVTVISDNKLYTVSFTYNGTNSSFLAQNVQACIDSLTIAPAQ